MTTRPALLESIDPDLHIGGKRRPASDGATIEVRDPATEGIIASVASASIEDGLAAVEAASEAGPQWAATSPRERGEILRRAYTLFVDRGEEFAELMSLENGKALADAQGEAAYAAESSAGSRRRPSATGARS